MTIKEYLLDHIKARGFLGVDEFMNIALAHPVHGYYMKKDPFGAAGDFTTAPEISQMFGEVIGAWIADIWMQMGKPDFTLLECGPGQGTLMADIIRSTKNIDGFHAAAPVHLLEMSPVLKEIQKTTLGPYCPLTPTLSPMGRGSLSEAKTGEGGVIWHETLDEIPRDRPLIIIANEFLDALSVRQLQKTKDGWAERVIDWNGNGFEFGLAPSPREGEGVFAHARAGEGDIIEISPARTEFFQTICSLLRKNGGAALFIDYGHVISAPGDTLQAVYKHQYCPVLEHIGEADLTAHVDFAALVRAAEGVNIHGPVEQGSFLKAIGIEQRAQALSVKANEKQRDDIQKALRRLTDSREMGSLFKVMGISHDPAVSPAGF